MPPALHTPSQHSPASHGPARPQPTPGTPTTCQPRHTRLPIPQSAPRTKIRHVARCSVLRFSLAHTRSGVQRVTAIFSALCRGVGESGAHSVTSSKIGSGAHAISWCYLHTILVYYLRQEFKCPIGVPSRISIGFDTRVSCIVMLIQGFVAYAPLSQRHRPEIRV